MEEHSIQCYKCRYFDRFYTKGAKRYNGVAYGWCCKKQSVVKTQSGCDSFAPRPRLPKRKLVIKVALSDILTEISEIRNILQDEDNENE